MGLLKPQSVPSSITEPELRALYRHQLHAWWRLVGILWLTAGPLTLWQLRGEIELLLDYFTWTAVSYGLRYNLLGSLGVLVCVGLPATLLLRSLRHHLLGLAPSERHRLEQQLFHIRRQGASHPLWPVIRSSSRPIQKP